MLLSDTTKVTLLTTRLKSVSNGKKLCFRFYLLGKWSVEISIGSANNSMKNQTAHEGCMLSELILGNFRKPQRERR